MTDKKDASSMDLIQSMVDAKYRVHLVEQKIEKLFSELEDSKLAKAEMESKINADESLCSILMSTGVVVSDSLVMYQDDEGNIKTKPFVKIPFLWELTK